MTRHVAGLRRLQQAVERSRVLPDLADRLFARYSLVDNTPFFDPGAFAWTALLEAHYPAIRAEAEQILRLRDALPNFQDIAPDTIQLSDDDQWKTYFFCGYGSWAKANAERCPDTTKVLRAIPGLTTAFFSILGPGKKLPPHKGPYKGVLRHHLALLVPEPSDACGITVGGQTRHWREGSSMVFDDTFEHEAWNDTDGERVVLFLDIVRPLRAPMSWVNTGLIKAVGRSPFVKQAEDRYAAWEPGFAAQWERKHTPAP